MTERQKERRVPAIFRLVRDIGAIALLCFLGFIAVETERPTAGDTETSDESYPARRLGLLPQLNDPKTTDDKQPGGRGRSLVHVFSPFHDPSPSPFSPLNHEQWGALVSAQQAQDAYASYRLSLQTEAAALFDSVIVVCAVVESDIDEIRDTLSPYCDHIIVLPRSTGTEYPGLKSLPFLQDIVNAGVAVMGLEQEEDYYLMLTNSDICLMKNFYVELEQMMTRKKTKSISLNRKLIRMQLIKLPTSMNDESFEYKDGAAKDLIHQAEDLVGRRKFKKHPGYDCFVFHTSILKMINFGDQFVGYPAWAESTDLALRIMDPSYQQITSRQSKHGTYHFGDERRWKPQYYNKSLVFDYSFWKDYSLGELEFIAWCPIVNFAPINPHNLQNVINCGKWFHTSDVSLVPSFVNAGYEEIYIKNWRRPKWLTLDAQGIAWRTPSPSKKREWIETYHGL